MGPRASAATLLFSDLRQPATPVDSHYHRVAQHLGLIGPKANEKAAHALLANLLPPDWNARQVYDHHEALMFHGQEYCCYQASTYGRCMVLTECPFGQAHFGRARWHTFAGTVAILRLRVRPGRPAHSGQANAALQGLLTATFDFAKHDVKLLADHTTPFKKVELAGLSDENLAPALAKLGTSARA